MLAQDAQHDAENPRSHRRGMGKLRKPAVDDEEDLLHDVVDRPFFDAGSPNAPPDEIDVALVDVLEARLAVEKIATVVGALPRVAGGGAAHGNQHAPRSTG